MPLELARDEFDAVTVVWNLLQQTGHAGHGAWSMDSRDGYLTCSCGAVVARLEAVSVE